MSMVLTVLCCLAAFLAPVWADTPVMFESVLTPSGHGPIIRSLDDPQPDTLAYDNGAIQSFYQTANMWSRVRFTAPDSFEVRSVYFVANNPVPSAAPCSVFVYSSVGGDMGQQLAGGRITGNVIHFTNFSSPTWNDYNFPTPVVFGPGEDFYIVIGPAPGGVQAAGWHILLDAGAVGRSGYASPNRSGPYTATANGDWLIRVGGEANAFVDVASEECYNANAQQLPKYQMLSGEVLTFKGAMRNNGNTAVDLMTVRWILRGPNGQTVFTNETTAGPINVGATVQVSATQTYTMTQEGEYLAACIADADDDALAANDTSWLRMFVGPLPRWFRYDDNGEADGYTSFTPGNGWGVYFKPVSYPARVESLRVNVGGAGASDLAIWLNDASGMPQNPLWTGTPTLAQGWNTVPVSPAVNLTNNQSFTVAFLYTSLSLGADANQPIAGEQPHMGTISWQFEGQWVPDNSGNWCIQAYVAAPPSAADDPVSGMPTQYELSQNYPNPFNPSTEITFALPQASHVNLAVYNTLGQVVSVLANGTYNAGHHAVTFDAADLPAGVYLYRLEAGSSDASSYQAIRKMMLVK